MFCKQYRPIVAALVGCALTGHTVAQSLTSLTWEQALSQAYNNQPALRNAALERQIAEARTAETRLQRQIKISGSAEALVSPLLPASVIPVGQFNVANPTDETVTVRFGTWWQSTFGLTASKPLYDAVANAEVREAAFQSQLADNQIQQTRSDLAVALAEAWYALLLANEEVHFTQSAQQTAEALLQETEARVSKGSGLLADANTARLAWNAATVRHNQATANQRLAQQTLVYRMGLPLEQAGGLTLADSLAGLLQRVQNTAPPALNLATAEQKRPDARELALDNALLGLKMATAAAQLQPTVSATAYLGANNLSNNVPLVKGDEWFANGNVGLKVAVPLSERWQLQRHREPLLLQQQQNAAQLDALRQKIQYDYAVARSAYEVALAKLPLCQSDRMLARQNADLARERFKAGNLLASAVADADNTLRQREYNYLQAAYDLLLAHLRLGVAQGEPLQGL